MVMDNGVRTGTELPHLRALMQWQNCQALSSELCVKLIEKLLNSPILEDETLY